MPRVDWRAGAVLAAAQQAAKDVAVMTAEIVKGKAVDLCPVESSQTRNSATVTEQENGAEISFNTPQAAWLHESQSYTPSHAGTGPGYLRQPLLEEEEEYQKKVAESLKAIFS